MKLGKLSLVAVMALGTSAFAIDNVKVNGEAKVWYQTSETSGSTQTATNNLDMFDNGGLSLANISLLVGVTADLTPGLSMGASAYALSTLGLENNLVGDVPSNKVKMGGTNTTVAERVQDQSWARELYLAYTAGKTTAKIGRQALNTPLAFTETWNVVDNTFDAAVLLNNDLPDTTLVAAWVGKHNGMGLVDPDGAGALASGRGSTVAHGGEFGDFAVNGAYAAGAINKSIPNTTVQAWYYNVDDVADAFWLQADAKLMGMVDLGIQYAGMNPDDSSTTLAALGLTPAKNTDMFAIKAAVDVSGVNLYAAYSSVDEGTFGFANVATGDKSMVYTSLGSIWLDGEIAAAPDTDAWKVGASTKLVPGVTLSASYAEAEMDGNGAGAAAAVDYNAWDVVANTTVGPVGLTAIYTQYEKELSTGVKAVDTDTLRIIASLKF